MAQITGTFSATGASAQITGSRVTIQLDFAGTATVQIQSQMPNGAWILVDTKTADYHGVFEPATTPIRLNCSAYTNAVDYALTS
jgi:hypothetical protein